jgi:putative FmdB family regulatory protein
MPTYDYRCSACGGAFEFFQSMTDGPKRKCPSCGKSKLVRQIGAGAGILFKGSGFYQTDYRSDSYKKSASAESSTSSTACTGDTKSCAANGGPCATPSSTNSGEKPSSKETKKRE